MGLFNKITVETRLIQEFHEGSVVEVPTTREIGIVIEKDSSFGVFIGDYRVYFANRGFLTIAGQDMKLLYNRKT